MTNDVIFSYSVDDIRSLLARHAPDWAKCPIQPVRSTGTDNTLFRLADKHVLRVPRRSSAIPLLRKELDWLPRLTGLSLATPQLRFRGVSPHWDFGIFDWIDGDLATPDIMSDPDAAAIALADFLRSLHQVPSDGAPRAGEINKHRGGPLHTLSERMLDAIAIVSDEVDAAKATEVWKQAGAAAYPETLAWVHGDLKANNLIAQSGKLTAVIDWGLSAVGDPAADFAAAWSWVPDSARATFRDRCQVDASGWTRAQGWALYGAVIALSYYRGGMNEALCQQSRLTLSRLGLMLPS